MQPGLLRTVALVAGIVLGALLPQAYAAAGAIRWLIMGMLFLVFLQTSLSRQAIHRSHGVLLVANLAMGFAAWGLGWLVGGREVALAAFFAGIAPDGDGRAGRGRLPARARGVRDHGVSPHQPRHRGAAARTASARAGARHTGGVRPGARQRGAGGVRSHGRGVAAADGARAGRGVAAAPAQRVVWPVGARALSCHGERLAFSARPGGPSARRARQDRRHHGRWCAPPVSRSVG